MLVLMLGALGLGQAMSDLGDQKAAIMAASRIFKLIDESAESPIDGLSNTAGTVPAAPVTGRIELRGVNFCYPTRPNVQVCRDYSLVIEPGQMVALVGASGSGKSTIVQLLLRFYDPQEGAVLLDGKDLRSLNVRWLRSQIGYVGQEPVLFTGSVQENVAKGRAEMRDQAVPSIQEVLRTQAQEERKNEEQQQQQQKKISKLCGCCGGTQPSVKDSVYRDVEGADPEDPESEASPSTKNNSSLLPPPDDIVEACKASHAHDFVMGFPQGYATDVGEGSTMVSGGQKQRIAIARALIKKPSVLLLDEATSALDAASERLVQQSIDELQQRKAQTTVVIAHRLSTVRNADKICVVEGGRIVEAGTHDELLALNGGTGKYATLWAKQAGSRSKSGRIFNPVDVVDEE